MKRSLVVVLMAHAVGCKSTSSHANQLSDGGSDTPSAEADAAVTGDDAGASDGRSLNAPGDADIDGSSEGSDSPDAEASDAGEGGGSGFDAGEDGRDAGPTGNCPEASALRLEPRAFAACNLYLRTQLAPDPRALTYAQAKRLVDALADDADLSRQVEERTLDELAAAVQRLASHRECQAITGLSCTHVRDGARWLP